jgi:hypothetical protein
MNGRHRRAFIDERGVEIFFTSSEVKEDMRFRQGARSCTAIWRLAMNARSHWSGTRIEFRTRTQSGDEHLHLYPDRGSMISRVVRPAYWLSDRIR